MHPNGLAAMVADAIQRERLAQAVADRRVAAARATHNHPARRVFAMRAWGVASLRPALARLNRRAPRVSGELSAARCDLQPWR